MKLKEIITEIDRLKAELDSLRPINPEQEARIWQKFRLDWNFHSNHLEGNSLTFGETKSFLFHGITASGKPLKDHLDIRGHNEALIELTDIVKDERPLTEAIIRELHKTILPEPYEVKAETPEGFPTLKRIVPGKYKTSPNHVKTITGEIFYFASPEETPAKMEELMNWFRISKDDANLHPLLLAAEYHYRFIRIHPFDDGNGRMARILMNLIFMLKGFPPVIIKTEKKEEYYRALQMADGGDINAFVEYIGNRMIASIELFLKGANGENIDEDDDLSKEIALLKAELKQSSLELNFINDIHGIDKFIKQSLSHLIHDLNFHFNQFDDIFNNRYIWVWVRLSNANNENEYDIGSPLEFPNGTAFNIKSNESTSEFYAFITSLITELNIENINIDFVFARFKYKPNSFFDISTRIKLKIENTHFIIMHQNKILAKRYFDDPISTEEIISIRKSIIKAILKGIKENRI